MFQSFERLFSRFICLQPERESEKKLNNPERHRYALYILIIFSGQLMFAARPTQS